jgi:hypothetical protein
MEEYKMEKNSLKKVVKISSGLFLAAVLCMPVMGTVEASALSNINIPTTKFNTTTTTTQNAYGVGLAYNSGTGVNNLTVEGAAFNVYATNFQVAGIALATNTGYSGNTLTSVGGLVGGGDTNTAMGLAWARNSGNNNQVSAAGGVVAGGKENSAYGIGYAHNTGSSNIISSTGAEIDGGYKNTAVGVSLVENVGQNTTINSFGVLGYTPNS